MAKGVRVKMNSRGARAVLQSQGAQDVVLPIAQRIASSAGPGFVADVQVGRNRAIAMAKTTDFESLLHNAKTNALLKGLGAG